MDRDQPPDQPSAPPPQAKRRGQPRTQVVDPAVSRAKFGREVDAFRRHEALYRSQGWFTLSAEFPEIFLVLTVPQLRPAPVLFGVVINFANYDIDPPSVVLVNPWTREPLRARELLSPLPRLTQRAPAAAGGNGEAGAVALGAGDERQRADADQIPETPGLAGPPVSQELPQIEVGNLMQWWTPDSIPFLCVRGVREYHRHPAHTGDGWLLHRGRGEGTLPAILSAIHDHGRAPIQDYFYEFNVQNQRAQHSAILQQIAVRVRGFLNILPGGVPHFWPF